MLALMSVEPSSLSFSSTLFLVNVLNSTFLKHYFEGIPSELWPIELKRIENMTNSGGLRVAIIEDESFMADLVQQMIEGPEVETDAFPFAKVFIDSPDAQKFDVLVLDLSLPDIDGFEFLELLATQTPSARVLLMSGHEDAVLRSAALYAKGLGFKVIGTLKKPFSRLEIRSALGLPL
jgi:CheY-like chemotaxis protein